MKAMTYREAAAAAINDLFDNDRWAMEPKYDGVRTLVECDADGVRLLNRNGTPLSAASTNAHRAKVATAFSMLRGSWVFDGELLDDGVLIVFDLPVATAAGGESLVTPTTPFESRREVLERLSEKLGWDLPESNVRAATHVRGADKQALYDVICETGGEGVMFKRLDAAYEEKRTKTAGVKVKFTATVDVVVTGTNIDGKENASLGVVEGAAVRDIGRCSLIGKPPVKIGDVVEVRYLYVGAGGRLVQPRLVRVRTDKAAVDCTADQLSGTEVNKWVA